MSTVENDYRKIIGNNIKLALAQKGYTQSSLSDELGMPTTQLNRYCLGKTMPSPDIFENIADQLDMSVEQLLYYQQLMSESEKTLHDLQDSESISQGYETFEGRKEDQNFDLESEMKAELQTVFNYVETLINSTGSKKVKSIAELIKQKLTFISANLDL